MIVTALEAELLALAMIFESELRTAEYWPKSRQQPRRPEELHLPQLVDIARAAGWLARQYLDGDDDGQPTAEDLDEVLRLVTAIRNLAAHPGRCVRELPCVLLGRREYDIAYPIVRTTFDLTYAYLQQAQFQTPER